MTKQYRIVQKIVSGHLDADRADYLLRDSYFCGVKYGEYDFDRYVQAFKIALNDNQPVFNIQERDIFIIESFLLARYHYNLQVPFHRTRGGYDELLKRYAKDIANCSDFKNIVRVSKAGRIQKVNFNKFEFFDDITLIQHIKNDSKKNKWAHLLLRYDHLVPVFDENSCSPDHERRFKMLVEELRKSTLKEGEDYFIYNRVAEVSKFINASTQAVPNREDRIFIINKDGKEICPIEQYSSVIKKLAEPVRISRIYTTKEAQPTFAKIFDEIDFSPNANEEAAHA